MRKSVETNLKHLQEELNNTLSFTDLKLALRTSDSHKPYVSQVHESGTEDIITHFSNLEAVYDALGFARNILFMHRKKETEIQKIKETILDRYRKIMFDCGFENFEYLVPLQVTVDKDNISLWTEYRESTNTAEARDIEEKIETVAKALVRCAKREHDLKQERFTVWRKTHTSELSQRLAKVEISKVGKHPLEKWKNLRGTE